MYVLLRTRISNPEPRGGSNVSLVDRSKLSPFTTRLSAAFMPITLEDASTDGGSAAVVSSCPNHRKKSTRGRKACCSELPWFVHHVTINHMQGDHGFVNILLSLQGLNASIDTIPRSASLKGIYASIEIMFHSGYNDALLAAGNAAADSCLTRSLKDSPKLPSTMFG